MVSKALFTSKKVFDVKCKDSALTVVAIVNCSVCLCSAVKIVAVFVVNGVGSNSRKMMCYHLKVRPSP